MINWNYNIRNTSYNIKIENYYENDKHWYENAEIETKKFIQNILKENSNIIDAGAQVGMYSLLFSIICPQGKIHSFEPTDTINFLNKNIQLNDLKNIETYKIALSNKSGKFVDKIFKVWSESIIEEKLFDFITIDDFVDQRNIEIDLIKIDVDSYDYEVLLGAKKTLLEQNPIVIVELNHALEKRGFRPEDGMNFMSEIGYKLDRVLDVENYIFIKK
jgi:FkbM family methyltransferase